MYFRNEEGRRVRITVRNAREGITSEEVSNAMDTIIAKNVFSPSLVSALDAEVEERTITEL